MNVALWKNRLAAAAAVGLAGLSVVSLVAITTNVMAVHDAKADAATTNTASVAPPSPPGSLRPILRRGAATQDVAIGEFLNGRLADVGFTALSIRTVSVRPLGGGLQLAEVRVEGRTDAAGAAAVANWVAVNREAVRLKSLSLSAGPDGAGQGALVLLMVIA